MNDMTIAATVPSTGCARTPKLMPTAKVAIAGATPARMPRFICCGTSSGTQANSSVERATVLREREPRRPAAEAATAAHVGALRATLGVAHDDVHELSR